MAFASAVIAWLIAIVHASVVVLTSSKRGSTANASWSRRALAGGTTYGNLSDYELGDYLGEGKFSKVYTCVQKVTQTPCVFKVLSTHSSGTVEHEVGILRHLRGLPRVVQLLDVVRTPNSTRHTTLVLERVNFVTSNSLYPILTDNDVREYSFQVLEGLASMHVRGVMHKDLKPDNILIDPARRAVKVSDMGQSQHYRPGKRYSPTTGSPIFRSPEAMLGIWETNYKVDLWAFGCIFAELIFRTSPDSLLRVIRRHGGGGLAKNASATDKVVYSSKAKNGAMLSSIASVSPYLKQFPAGAPLTQARWAGARHVEPWRLSYEAWPRPVGRGRGYFPRARGSGRGVQSRWATPRGGAAVGGTFLDPGQRTPVRARGPGDLLGRLLVYDPEERLSASEALRHPYFAEARRLRAQQQGRARRTRQ